MKRSEIKDLYNQSDSALRLLKCMALILPYCNGEQATAEATQKAAAQAAALWNPVKVMCDYMIDDGSIDMTERLQNIKAEVSQIELSVAKMGYSKEQMPLLLNCRAIINQIKDMEAWTANNPQPQQKHTEAPQQPIGGISGELAGNGNENAPEALQQSIRIITINNTDLEISVFSKAITKGYIILKPDGTYEWNKTNRLLAYMCGRLYCGDRVKEDKSDYTTEYKKGRGKLPAKELKNLFGVDVGKTRDNIDVPEHYDIIDELFKN